MRDSTLSQNSALLWGGAIHTEADTIIQSTTIRNNMAPDGGGIWKTDGILIIRGSELVNNTATGGPGGAIRSLGDSVKIERSALIGNAAPTSGGGGVNATGGLADWVLIVNTTFSANTAATAGGIYLGNMVQGFVGNTTMVDNSDPGGVASDLSVGSNFTLSNSILTHPTAGASPQCTLPAGVNMAGQNNLIDAAGAPSGCLGAAANFRLGSLAAGTLGSLALHGGRSRSYSLLMGSNAIDGAGGNCMHPYTGNVVGLDQRYQSRPPDPCDIGSFEKK